METAKPPTSLSMLLLLLLLWVTIGSALPKRELHMLEMMQNILGVDSADLSGRSQRSSPMLFASSVPCEDSLPEDSSAQLSLFEEDFDESEECGDYGRPCHGATQLQPGLEPCARPMLPMQHPCFVRVVLLRTPLLRHDPCTNFTLGMAQPTTTSTTTTSPSAKKPRGKKCRPKMRKSTPRPAFTAPSNNSTSSSTSPATSTTELETTTTSTTSTTTSRPAEASTTEGTTSTTTTARSTTTTTPSTTTTELLPTIMELDEMPTTTTAPNSTTVVYTRRNQLKSLRGRRRKPQRGKLAGVPDKPTIKLDGTMQPSDTFPVFLTTEAAELRSRPKSTTLRPEALAPTSAESETTTECIEASDDEETATENAESRANEEEAEEEDNETEASEDCEDAENQDTNLCPQFSAPEEAANMRLMPPGSRFRKPVKNYVEPILYEGQFAKPRQRIGMLPPQRRDFYVSNKQIMPRPKPKLRQPLPHSIYMNNIVRGLKCSDEAGAHGHPPQSGRFLSRRPTTTPQRIWLNRRNGAGYAPMGSKPSAQGPQRGRGNPLYGLSSAEDPDSYGHDSDQYYDDDIPDRLAWPRDHPLHGSSPTADPCQAELNRERQRQREREREREREQERESDRDRDNEHLLDYPQRPSPRFFT